MKKRRSNKNKQNNNNNKKDIQSGILPRPLGSEEEGRIFLRRHAFPVTYHIGNDLRIPRGIGVRTNRLVEIDDQITTVLIRIADVGDAKRGIRDEGDRRLLVRHQWPVQRLHVGAYKERKRKKERVRKRKKEKKKNGTRKRKRKKEKARKKKEEKEREREKKG